MTALTAKSRQGCFYRESEVTGSMDEEKLEALSGTVEEVVFHNEDNGYCVFDLAADTEELVTCVGNVPRLYAGESVILYGNWKHHPSYGRQFQFSTYQQQMPADLTSILRYLSSGAVKGIGPKTAQRIVTRFGIDSFDIIENHPDYLAEVPGISAKKAKEISERFREQSGIRSVMIFCQEFFGPSVAIKIYKRWGKDAISTIKENPYSICREIEGVGFEQTDAIAASLGIPPDHPSRIESGIGFVLQQNAVLNGHTCLPLDKLSETAARVLGLPLDAILTGIEQMRNSGALVTMKGAPNTADLVFSERTYRAERYAADKLMTLDRECRPLGIDGEEVLLTKLEVESNIRYAALQRKAVHDACASGVFILTGGPGTGKTTVIRALIRIFQDIGLKVALAAPTGRAAKRMSEATVCETKTIHRLLEMSFQQDDEPVFQRNENNLLTEDVVILDESSMIDVFLLEALLRAVKRGSRVIFIGDSDQLPSVGAGNVLSDLLACNRFSTVRLTEIFRQGQHSRIVLNAHAINRGEVPQLRNDRDGDFFYIPCASSDAIAETVVDLCKNRLPDKYGELGKNGVQVITPSRKGRTGTETLNLNLQEALNPSRRGKPEKTLRDRVFRVGDRVMQIRNNYDMEWMKDGESGSGVFNGDIGVIEDMNFLEESLFVNFDGRHCIYDYSMCDELEHAYAVTVHKSQGSEYPIVIIPLGDFSPALRTRNLLYTAVTRARQMVILVGSRDVIQGMVQNNRHTLRYTGLCAMLTDMSDS